MYSERSDDWVQNTDRLARKFDTARTFVPGPVIDETEGAEVGIIAFGSTMYAIDEARDRLAADGLQTSFMRLRALPINGEVRRFIGRYERLFVIELNRDGQLHAILQTEVPEAATKLLSLARMDGLPLTPHGVVDAVRGALQGASQDAHVKDVQKVRN